MTDAGRVEYLYMHTLLDLAQRGLTGSKAAQTDKYTYDPKKFPSAAPAPGVVPSSAKAATKAPTTAASKSLLLSVLQAAGSVPPSEMTAKINREFEARTSITNS